ncbi:NUDIX domain-containing protein [Microbacterium gorillae]|uniref:NUDIX domain-containing protein n=1 Tax=Microbacterium gorillae TaxID=1231063 RepID=UPI000591650C|nr:NUDIX domain-containing protein [Microbacterium gorillae]
MAVHSAGIALVRGRGPERAVLAGHMGGPFWARKDEGAWSLPKGEYDPATESAWDAAVREFGEETGLRLPEGDAREVGVFRVTSVKQLTVFRLAVPAEADIDLGAAVFGTFELEWPPRSGRMQEFPELDRLAWLAFPSARERLVVGQRPILDVL